MSLGVNVVLLQLDLMSGHILSRVYKPDNRPILTMQKTAHLHYTFRFYNCTNCDQLSWL